MDEDRDGSQLISPISTKNLVKVFLHFREVGESDLKVRDSDDFVKAFRQRGQDGQPQNLIRLACEPSFRLRGRDFGDVDGVMSIPEVPPLPGVVGELELTRDFLGLFEVVERRDFGFTFNGVKRLTRMRLKELTLAVLKNATTSETSSNDPSLLKFMTNISSKSTQDNDVWTNK